MNTDLALEDWLPEAFDLHVHTSPDIVPRRYSDLETAKRCVEFGLAGIVVKSHNESTVGRAAIASEVSGGCIFGGLVLNRHVCGGLNVLAAEASLQLGARIVWLPTKSSRSHSEAFPSEGTSSPISLSDPGALDSIVEICGLVREASAVLATGHLSTQEIATVAKVGAQVGARILVTHPDYVVPGSCVNDQRLLADDFPGLVFERSAFLVSEGNAQPTDISLIVCAIRETGGPGRNIVSSDLGQVSGLDWPQGLAVFGSQLRSAGLSGMDVNAMMRETPANLMVH